MRRHKLTKNKDGLNIGEVEFVEHYLDAESPTYLNGFQTAKLIAEKRDLSKNKGTIQTRANKILKRPAVVKCIRDRLNQPDIDEMLERGVRSRLSDPEKKGWQETADFVAKLRGDFAPERHLNMEMTQEDRDQVYAEIMDKIRHAQSS